MLFSSLTVKFLSKPMFVSSLCWEAPRGKISFELMIHVLGV